MDLDHAAVAAALATAERTATPIDPLTESYPGITATDAYRIQQIGVERRIADGAAVRGYKVGLTARAMQQMMGVNEPDFGRLLDDMVLADRDELATATLCTPRIEPELAFVLGTELPEGRITPADVVRATEFVVPCLEVIDSRFHGWKIRFEDTVADNASSARVVLAGSAARLEELDLRYMGCVLRRNGEVLETGASGAVMGHPVNAVTWLVNTLRGLGTPVDAGTIVLPGSMTRAIDVGKGDTVTATFAGLGHVSARFV